MKKHFFLLAAALLCATPSFSQFDFSGIETSIVEADNFVKKIFPIIISIVVGIGFLFNMGKLWGQNRDYKEFFTNMGLVVLGLTVVGAIIAGIRNMSF